MKTDETPPFTPPPSCECRLSAGLIYDTFWGTLRAGTKPRIKLSGREYQCVVILSQAHPQGVGLKTKALDMHLHALRRKLRSLGFEIRYSSNCFFWTTRDCRKSRASTFKPS